MTELERARRRIELQLEEPGELADYERLVRADERAKHQQETICRHLYADGKGNCLRCGAERP